MLVLKFCGLLPFRRSNALLCIIFAITICVHAFEERRRLSGSSSLSLDDRVLELAAAGNITQVMTLLPFMANLAHDSGNGTLVHLAVRQGWLRMARDLIESQGVPVDVTAADPSGSTPLHVACQIGDRQATSLLIILEADVTSATGDDRRNCLHLAAATSIPGSAEQVLQLVATSFRSRFDFALEGKQFFDARTSKEELTPLMIAAFYGNSQAAELFLANGADPNAQDVHGNTPAHYIAQFGKIDRPRDSTAARNDTMLVERKQQYLQHDVRTIDALKKRGMDPNLTNFRGRTPLHYAAMFGRTAIVKQLMEAGASQYTKDQDGFTAVDLARKAGQDKLVIVMNDPWKKQVASLTAEISSTTNQQMALVGLKEDLRKWKSDLREEIASGLREALASHESSVLLRLKSIEQRVTVIQNSLDYCFQHARSVAGGTNDAEEYDQRPDTMLEDL